MVATQEMYSPDISQHSRWFCVCEGGSDGVVVIMVWEEQQMSKDVFFHLFLES
jgi:hypothetical protein